MTGPKTNEREGTRAVLRNTRTSAYKIREVLDIVRGLPVGEASDVLRFSERDAAAMVLKLLNSAVANAENNDDMLADELYVSACYADEGRTYKTFRPRARGRAGRIRKRTAHITIIVSRLPEQRLGVVKAKQERAESDRRTRRVAASQKQGGRLRRTRRGGAGTAADGGAGSTEPDSLPEDAVTTNPPATEPAGSGGTNQPAGSGDTAQVDQDEAPAQQPTQAAAAEGEEK